MMLVNRPVISDWIEKHEKLFFVGFVCMIFIVAVGATAVVVTALDLWEHCPGV